MNLKSWKLKVVGIKVKVMATFGQDNVQSSQLMAMTSFGLGNQRLFEVKVIVTLSHSNIHQFRSEKYKTYTKVLLLF